MPLVLYSHCLKTSQNISDKEYVAFNASFEHLNNGDGSRSDELLVELCFLKGSDRRHRLLAIYHYALLPLTE